MCYCEVGAEFSCVHYMEFKADLINDILFHSITTVEFENLHCVDTCVMWSKL